MQPRTLLVASLLTVASFLAAGCGDDGDGGGSTKPTKSASAKGKDCDGGPISNEEREGLRIVRHCGDGSATVVLDGEETTISGGTCENSDDSVVFNVGSTVVDPDAGADAQTKFDYLGILVGAHPAADGTAPAASEDGTYTEGVLVSGAAGGAAILAPTGVELILTDGRTKGTFTGRTIAGDELTGSFDCG